MADAAVEIKESVKAFKGQVYGDLASQHDESNLFEDPEFPATDKSMYFSQRPPTGVRWLRPKVHHHIKSSYSI